MRGLTLPPPAARLPPAFEPSGPFASARAAAAVGPAARAAAWHLFPRARSAQIFSRQPG